LQLYIDFFKDRGKILAKAGYSMKYIFSWYAFIAANCIIIFLSIFPLGPYVQPVFPLADKLFHLFIYTGLSFISVNTFFLKGKKHPRIASFFYAALLGLLMESVQFALPYRSFETADIFSNCLGGVLGCLLRIT